MLNRNRMAAVLLGLAVLLVTACANSILFVGNSFTFGGDSPPVQEFQPETVTDLNREGVGGVPALFKAFTREAGLTYDGRDRQEATDGGGSVPCPWPLDGIGVGSPTVDRRCAGHEPGGVVEVVPGEVGAGRDPEPGHAVGHARRAEAAHEDTLGA